jgi:hypothetical protein
MDGEVSGRITDQAQARHDGLGTKIVSSSVSKYLVELRTPKSILETGARRFSRVAIPPNIAMKAPPDLMVRAERVILRGWHHPAVA